MYERWTKEEDDFLKEYYPNNTKKDVQEKFKDKAWLSICRRARKLNLHRLEHLINEDRKNRGPRSDAWSPKEDSLLKEIYESSSKKEMLSRIDRPWKGIWSRAYSFNLHRNPEILKEEMIEGGKNAPPKEDTWTNQQIGKLKDIYENNSKKDILAQMDKSWKAIRGKACSLGLFRNKEIIIADNIIGTKEAMLRNHGIEYFTQLESMKEKSRETNIRKRGVPYPTQSADVREKVKETVKEKFGVDNVFQNEDIKEKIKQTNIKQYGVANPLQNPVILQKVHDTAKENNSFSLSEEEMAFYDYLKEIDSYVEHQVTHPIVGHIIDYYSPKFNIWIQYDGDYWHGRNPIIKITPRVDHIIGTIERDKIQKDQIPNLVRFWDSDIKNAINNGTIKSFVFSKIMEKAEINYECHQYKKKVEFLKNDIAETGIDPTSIKASDFVLKFEFLTPEIVSFIKKYEWLGNIGVTPKWCFTAKNRDILGGVVLINEPTSYSKLIGESTPTYEALIQRGATASWTPKNLGSRLIMFACRWMVDNTNKRIFIGYGDPKAHEIGTIYQACNFEYIGDKFGSSFLYRNPLIKNGNSFSAQSLKRTSSFRRWCKENKVALDNSWIKDNGFKDLSKIPLDIKHQWYNWIKDTIANSEKFPTEKKHKYALLLWKNNKEKKELLPKKTYKTFPYPKRGKQNSTDLQNIFEGSDKPLNLVTNNTTPKKAVSTRSRATPDKLNCIIENFHSNTVKELAAILKETTRWVESQIKKLIKEGKLQPKNPIGSTRSRVSKEKIDFIKENYGKKSVIQIANELKETKRWVKRQIKIIRTNHP